MKIIFCCDPMDDEVVDTMYIDEVAAATRAGLEYELIDYDAINRQNNAARAVRDIPVSDEQILAVYRGWMLSTKKYAALYDALLSRGIQLINDARHYKHTQHLPESLDIIEEKTPRTEWMETDGHVTYDAVMQLLLPFAGRPVIVKDFVKAEKHYWNQACYISSSSDEAAVRNTVQRFLELRGDDFEGGLVFREYMDFEPLAQGPASGMPLNQEYRIFYLNHQPILTVHYWDIEGDVKIEQAPAADFAEIARQVRSRFFTMDVAKSVDGDWLIIELGDAQVASLPKTADEDTFYRALAGAH